MINVELSPATYLGVVLIGSGITLLQIRNQKPVLSRDTDIIAACISILAGGILIFQVLQCATLHLLVCASQYTRVQGWRLDPILLFEQLLIASTAIAFGIEALRLRSELPSSLQQDESLEAMGAMDRRGRALPPPPEQAQPWMQQAQQGAQDVYAQQQGFAQDPYAQQQPPWPQQVWRTHGWCWLCVHCNPTHRDTTHTTTHTRMCMRHGRQCTRRCKTVRPARLASLQATTAG